MWFFEEGLETVNVKKYKQMLRKKPIRLITEFMAMDYLKSSDQAKLLIKYRIQDILNDIERCTTLSMTISLIGLIIGRTSEQYKKVFLIVLFIIYSIITLYLICSNKYYRVCKLYLEVIKDIDEERLELKLDLNNEKYLVFKNIK